MTNSPHSHWRSSVDSDDMRMILYSVLKDQEIHHRWLFTLSYLENCGARKIKQMESSLFPSLLILKHGAEEARHAYFFRRQILKLAKDPDQHPGFLGGMRAKNYLNLLDVQISKNIKRLLNLDGQELKMASYLLTTYCVEVRAEWLFSLYQELLNKLNININLATILKEEENHLEEMMLEIDKNEKVKKLIPLCLEIEGQLFFNLFDSIRKELRWKSSAAKSKESHSEMRSQATLS
ncbi:MAG: hypothetical protein ACO20H_01620 [Bacteriovoracaceae bacterium]